jgi:hypothetical protein
MCVVLSFCLQLGLIFLSVRLSICLSVYSAPPRPADRGARAAAVRRDYDGERTREAGRRLHALPPEVGWSVGRSVGG